MKQSPLKISLVRHGRPAVDFAGCISGAQLEAWVRDYEAAGLDASLRPPPALQRALSDCGLVLTSSAPRSIQSAELLGLSAAREVEVALAEAPLPPLFCPLPLRPTTLMALARMFWLLDVAKGNEGKRAVRARADKLALDLHSRARDHCHVAVVGHGFMFRFLGGALEARGWRRVNGHMRGYWSRTQFETERR